MINFNLTYFQENFEKFKQHFDNGSGHPENFYCEFYDEFIAGDEMKLFTDEEQTEWINEWIEALDEPLLSEMNFYEIINSDEYYYLTEDLTGWVIDSDEPKFSKLKEKFIAQLFFYISEVWSKESITNSMEQINEENN
tara:strand:+ start:56 stop:469 length:414 start_codon:yes stop_codon:yes gene_type:complete